MKLQRYRHDSPVSYTLGATLTYEMLKEKPELVKRLFIRPSTDCESGIGEILALAAEKGIRIEESEKAFNILSPKGNCYLIGEFEKREERLKSGNHIVLVNPSDAGNMGTIVRTAAGFGFGDIAVIRQAVDFFDPRTIRATMGAAFHMRVEYFDTIEDYIKKFGSNERYAFMLTGSTPLPAAEKREPYSLIFGNEATGLPDRFADFCTAVRINHSGAIDSLNLPMAAGIAMYEFTKNIWNQ